MVRRQWDAGEDTKGPTLVSQEELIRDMKQTFRHELATVLGKLGSVVIF